jgi:hypothetical protein
MSIPTVVALCLCLVSARCGTHTSAPSQSGSSGLTYYVDSAAGNDSNAGTRPEAPWKTLARVNANVFSPGDKILFRSGSTLTGQLAPRGSGTEQHPIRIDKYGGEAKPVIQADGLAEDALLLRNQEYWEVQNLEITNTGKSAAVRRGVQVVAENYGEMHHIYLRSLTIHDVNGVDSEKVNGGIHYSAIGDSKPSRFVDLRIENNRIYHVDRSGIFGWSTHWLRSKWYPSLGVIVRNNTLDDIGGDGIVVVATDGALVEHNVVSRANQRSEGYNAGIWPWSADNTIVQFNEVYGTRGQRDGEGFDSDWNSRNTIIQYNYSHENDGGFLLICNDGSQRAADSVGNTGTIVRYNISQNDHHRGINIAGPVSDTLIYNNTIYVGKREDVDLVLHSDWSGWAARTSFFNNIFYVDGTARFSYGVSRGPDGAYTVAPGDGKSTGNFYDSNVYYGISPRADAHALTGNPLLSNPGGAGVGRESASAYRLRGDSPARDSGRDVTNHGGHDFFGTAIPRCERADRGAAETNECKGSQ